jgi:hypothetical protein
MGLTTEKSEFDSQQEARELFLLHSFHVGWGAHSAPNPVGNGGASTGVSRPGR